MKGAHMRRFVIAFSLAVAITLTAVASLPITNFLVAEGGDYTPDADTDPTLLAEGGDHSPVDVSERNPLA
jgi:hypothetical protein